MIARLMQILRDLPPRRAAVSPEDFRAFFSSPVWTLAQYELIMHIEEQINTMSNPGSSDRAIYAAQAIKRTLEWVLDLQEHLSDRVCNNRDTLAKAEELQARIDEITRLCTEATDTVKGEDRRAEEMN